MTIRKIQKGLMCNNAVQKTDKKKSCNKWTFVGNVDTNPFRTTATYINYYRSNFSLVECYVSEYWYLGIKRCFFNNSVEGMADAIRSYFKKTFI